VRCVTRHYCREHHGTGLSAAARGGSTCVVAVGISPIVMAQWAA
jgi:hypothetical protein